MDAPPVRARGMHLERLLGGEDVSLHEIKQLGPQVLYLEKTRVNQKHPNQANLW